MELQKKYFCTMNFEIVNLMQYDDLCTLSKTTYSEFTLFYVAECFKDRTDVQCLHRWQKVLNPDLVKGPWSRQVRKSLLLACLAPSLPECFLHLC